MSQKIKIGSVTLNAYEWRKPGTDKIYWRAVYHDPETGQRKYLTRATKKALIEAARSKAREIHNGSVDLSSLNVEEVRLVRAFLDLKPSWDDIERMKRERSRLEISLSDARDRFISAKIVSAGEETQEIGKIRRVIERFSEAIGEGVQVADIHSDEISEWLSDLDVGAKRRKAVRDNLCQFWRWMRSQDLIVVSTHLTEPEKTPLPKTGPKAEVRILSVEEMAFILENVSPNLLPWIVINGFSGLRVSEIRSARKPPLLWRHIDRDEELIKVPAEISKNRRRRFAPILPTLGAWLDTIPKGQPDAPVISQLPTEFETIRLGHLLDEHFKRKEGWPENCLRHSYGSYRVAQTKDVAGTAHEMDNSESVIRSNYLKSVSPVEAESFFSLHPSEISQIFSDEK